MRNVGFLDEGALLTSDGCVSAIATLPEAECCPPDICNLDPCKLMCSFIELLPNGPLWDKAKATAMDRYRDLNDPCAGTCEPDATCATIADYAAYSGYRLHGLLQGALWPALRESRPETAVETLDSWLEMLGWENPWESLCRDPRLGPSPLDCANEPTLAICDANFSPVYVPQLPPALDMAVKRGIALALTRLQMSPMKNLCGINWVIEPLGAILTPSSVPSTSPCCGSGLTWVICNRGSTIESVPGLVCGSGTHEIPASFEIPSLAFSEETGMCVPTGPDKIRIWPAVMAAQVIALSMLPTKGCSMSIVRCEIE